MFKFRGKHILKGATIGSIFFPLKVTSMRIDNKKDIILKTAKIKLSQHNYMTVF